MHNFLFIIAPPIWPKLPLIGPAYILENLHQHKIKTHVIDLNIQIYHAFKKKNQNKLNWTANYHFFQENFFDDIADQYNHHIQNIINLIKTNKINYIGFSVYKSNFFFSLCLAKLLKNTFPKITIIFGGPHISYLHYYNPDYFSIPYVEHFVIGEGENIILDIINKKIKRKLLYSKQITKLDDLPFPQYNNFQLKLYERKNALPILFSRGCINQCNFCFEKLQFPLYTTHSPEYIIEEMKFHIQHNKTHWFTFYDSLFNGHLKNLKKLLELIIQHNLKIIWDAQISIRQDMDDELFQLMKKSGCINLFIGLESGSQEILNHMNKNFTLPIAEQFIKKLSHHQINFEISLILNYPSEGSNHVQETIHFILQNKKWIKKIAQINPFVYYPGTKTDITQGYNFYAGIDKVKQLTHILDKHNIEYTNAYINNLTT